MGFQKKPESNSLIDKITMKKDKISGSQNSGKRLDTSLFKKNEFVVILAGALFLTFIIFFFFFRSPDPKNQPGKQMASDTSFLELEQRIQDIEKKLLGEGAQFLQTKNVQNENSMAQIQAIEERVDRFETLFSVKLDSLIERVGIVEKSILRFKNRSVNKKVNQKPEPEIVISEKKAMKTAVKKKSRSHIVQKKETLYSISKKYSISIAKLKKLNKLSENAILYPGDKLLLR
jgi:LysM repeat protein